jgi:predicted transglutaminase-like cysteine proteinase
VRIGLPKGRPTLRVAGASIMPALLHSGRAARALARALALVAVITGVEPSTATPRKVREVSPAQPARLVDSHARFFTIKDVLARHDGFESWKLRLASLGPADTASDAPIAHQIKLQKSMEPFGLVTFRAPEGTLWENWRRLESEMNAEAETLARCRASTDACSAPARKFLAMVDAARSLAAGRIETVNRQVNAAIHFTSDLAQHGVADRWTAPLATLAAGAGDCEDYAFAKYAILRVAGIPAEDMRVLLVRDLQSRQDHAVLAVRQETRWLVLDNRWAEPVDAAELRRFVPLFAIDERGVNLFAAPYAARPGA